MKSFFLPKPEEIDFCPLNKADSTGWVEYKHRDQVALNLHFEHLHSKTDQKQQKQYLNFNKLSAYTTL